MHHGLAVSAAVKQRSQGAVPEPPCLRYSALKRIQSREVLFCVFFGTTSCAVGSSPFS